MTMHRDLDVLETEGWVTKIRGGATANPSALIDAGVRERASAMHAEKAAIAELAAGMLRHGQTVFLDDSTTALELVPFLLAHRPVTVATNFVVAVEAFGDSPALDVHLLGGDYHPRQQSCHGVQTIAAIERLRADLLFMSTTALSDGKCLHRSEATVMVREAFLRNSTRKVLLVDHAKLGRQAPHVLCSVDEFDTVITDEGIDDVDLDALRARCDDVRVATTT